MDFIEQSWVFDEYRKVFRNYIPPIFVQEQMLMQVENVEAWRKTCFDWGMNDYKPSSVGKMLDYYRQQLAKPEPTFRQARGQVGKSQEPARPEPKCKACFDLGKTINFRRENGNTLMDETPCPECSDMAIAV